MLSVPLELSFTRQTAEKRGNKNILELLTICMQSHGSKEAIRFGQLDNWALCCAVLSIEAFYL